MPGKTARESVQQAEGATAGTSLSTGSTRATPTPTEATREPEAGPNPAPAADADERPLRILFHHRTGATDAQGIHIYECIRNFREQGHEVLEVALVHAGDGPPSTSRQDTGEKRGPGLLGRIKGRMPNFARELGEVAYNVVGYFKLARAIRQFKPDFIYDRYTLYSACGVWAAKRFNIPNLMEMNAVLVLEQDNEGKLAFRRLAYKIEVWTLSNATRTIICSKAMQRMYHQLGVPNEKMVLLYNGVDPEHFHGRDTSAAIKARYGLQGKRVLGFVGWIREWHGLQRLVEKMATWGEELADVHLLVVGEGPARSTVEQTAARLGLSDRVHFTGPVGREQMPDHIAAFDIALQPAGTPYCNPMKIFEYLGMGKPILAPRQPNFQEILDAGVCAEFFTPGDPLDLARVAHEMLSDPEKLRRMSQGARGTIQRRGYLWSENARRVARWARECIAELGPKRIR